MGVKKEQVGDTGSHKSSSAVIKVHFDKFFMSSLDRTAAVALREQTITEAHPDLSVHGKKLWYLICSCQFNLIIKCIKVH